MVLGKSAMRPMGVTLNLSYSSAVRSSGFSNGLYLTSPLVFPLANFAVTFDIFNFLAAGGGVEGSREYLTVAEPGLLWLVSKA